MTRTRVRPHIRRRRVVLAFVVALMIVPVARAAAGTGPGTAGGPAGLQRYVVQPGDTLWGIAARTHENPRYGVDQMLEENAGIDPGSLQPGQILLIPG